jgi:streptogramin lyase
MIFNGPNTIIYTQVVNSQIDIFNTLTSTNSVLATGFAQPRDLVLDPSGTTLVVSDFLSGTIDRVVIATGVTTVLSHPGGTPDGLAYDGKGDLFVVINRDQIVQIDPTTGAVLAKSKVFDGNLDGLTFDTFSGKLWVASENGGIFSVTTDLGTVTGFTGPAGTSFDGIEGNGLGSLFLANFGANVYQFTIASGTFTSETAVPGIDDLAPIVGGGSGGGPTPAPEPGSWALLVMGLTGVITFARRRALV